MYVRRAQALKEGMTADDIDTALDEGEEQGLVPKDSIIEGIMRRMREKLEHADATAAETLAGTHTPPPTSIPCYDTLTA